MVLNVAASRRFGAGVSRVEIEPRPVSPATWTWPSRRASGMTPATLCVSSSSGRIWSPVCSQLAQILDDLCCTETHSVHACLPSRQAL